jgi:hypothetical protein
MSVTASASARKISTTDHEPEIEAETCATRGSRAGGGIDLFKQRDLGGKFHAVERRGIGIKMAIGAHRRRGLGARRRVQKRQRFARPRNRCGGNFIGMGKAGHLARHAAQAKACLSAVVAGFQPAIIKAKGFGRDELQIKLAIVALGQSAAHQSAGFIGFKLAGTVKQRAGVGRKGHAVDIGRCRRRAMDYWRGGVMSRGASVAPST